ncbi:MAG: hypothetical protein HQL40_21340 [Alphaproteobacteria bacterium]|nr:hypothetical protein [Alphaproteobacteria bacterium]
MGYQPTAGRPYAQQLGEMQKQIARADPAGIERAAGAGAAEVRAGAQAVAEAAAAVREAPVTIRRWSMQAIAITATSLALAGLATGGFLGTQSATVCPPVAYHVDPEAVARALAPALTPLLQRQATTSTPETKKVK